MRRWSSLLVTALFTLAQSTVVPFHTASKPPGYTPSFTTHACGPTFGSGGNTTCQIQLCPSQSLVVNLCVEYRQQDTVTMLLDSTGVAVAEDDDGVGGHGTAGSPVLPVQQLGVLGLGPQPRLVGEAEEGVAQLVGASQL